MKRLFKLLTIMLFVLMMPTVFAESSRFTPKASLQNKELDKSNYFYVVLSYKGESVNKIEQELTYNGRFLEFIDANELNGYQIDVGNITKSGKYRKIKIESKSDDDSSAGEYAVITFRVLNTFKIGKNTYINLEDYKAYSEDGVSKYKYDGIEVEINRETLNRVALNFYDINAKSKLRNTIADYITKFLMVVVIVFIIVLLVVLLPSKAELQSTHREKEASKKVAGKSFIRDNYKFDIDEIKQIGEPPKEEPTNKLELGEFDPFKDNVAKREDVKFDESRDFKAVDASVFTSRKPLEETKLEAPKEEVKKEVKTPAKENKVKSAKKSDIKLTKPKKVERKNVKEGKDGLVMINSKKLDDVNKDDLD